MEHAILKAGCAIGAGICMGIGAIGPGIGEGIAVSKALEGMARSRGEEVLPRRRALEEVREGLAKMKEEWEVCQQA